jgi:WD40 repeat protein
VSSERIIFSNNNKWLVTGSRYRSDSKLWELPSEKQPVFLRDEKNIRSINFSPDSKWLVTTNADSTARLRELSVASNTIF